jgi:hypothetical protein
MKFVAKFTTTSAQAAQTQAKKREAVETASLKLTTPNFQLTFAANRIKIIQ